MNFACRLWYTKKRSTLIRTGVCKDDTGRGTLIGFPILAAILAGIMQIVI